MIETISLVFGFLLVGYLDADEHHLVCPYDGRRLYVKVSYALCLECFRFFRIEPGNEVKEL